MLLHFIVHFVSNNMDRSTIYVENHSPYTVMQIAGQNTRSAYLMDFIETYTGVKLSIIYSKVISDVCVHDECQL